MKKFVFSNEEIAAVCNELKYLLHAGTGNADALSLLAQDETRPAYKQILSEMAEKADTGMFLSEVFEAQGCFPPYVSKMLAVGETAGRTEEALSALARACENRASLDQRMKSSLLYPALLFLIMLAVVAILLIYVLPIFNDIYAELGSGLTGIAGKLLRTGRALRTVSPLLIVLFAAVAAFLGAFAALPGFRESVLDRWWNSRGDKGVSAKVNAARFAQALSMGMSSGLPVEEAVTAAGEAAGSPDTAAKSRRCIELLNDGRDLSGALKEAKLLPAGQCRLLEAGVRGGAGETAMEQIALRLTEESEIALEESIGRIEPAMVILSSVLIGFILLSVMLPLMHIMTAIG